MRHNQNRRSRGRSRKGPNPLTRSYESNGPDVKVRGNAAHVAEKYMTLARDAQSSGDPIAAENYLQHAEHYNRIVQAAQAQFQQSQPQFREGGEEGYDDDRQMNGRDRFDYNGGGRDDEGGDDRFDSNESEDDRGYRPMQSRQGGDQNNDRDGNDRQQRGPRNDRNDRYDNRRDRGYRDNREGRDRSEQRFQRQDEPQPEAAAAPPVEAEAAAPLPAAEEGRSAPKKRRGRPPRNGSDDAATEDTTPDGAAALAAFPD